MKLPKAKVYQQMHIRKLTDGRKPSYENTFLPMNPDRHMIQDAEFIVYFDRITLQVEGVVRKGIREGL